MTLSYFQCNFDLFFKIIIKFMLVCKGELSVPVISLLSSSLRDTYILWRRIPVTLYFFFIDGESQFHPNHLPSCLVWENALLSLKNYIDIQVHLHIPAQFSVSLESCLLSIQVSVVQLEPSSNTQLFPFIGFQGGWKYNLIILPCEIGLFFS